MFNYTVLTSFVSPPTSAKPISKPTFNLNLWNFSSGINIYGQYTAKASAMDGRISSHRTMLLYLFFGILATPFTHRHSIIVCVGGGYGVRSEKWNGQHIAKHLIFYFPPIRYTIFIFVWFQGCVRFNELDELSQQQQHGDDGWKKNTTLPIQMVRGKIILYLSIVVRYIRICSLAQAFEHRTAINTLRTYVWQDIT